MLNISSIIILIVALAPLRIYGQQTGKWGDQGDGSYRNPVIAADFSDPDPIRVNSDYYMVSSTFESVPGVTVLHSRDLVNWEIIGGVFNNLDAISPAFSWRQMRRYKAGVYAPSIRYHDGKFWVFVNFYTDGFFVATAKTAAGPWTVQQIKDKNGKPLKTYHWTDPCPFWDDNGKAYLASSRPPGKHWFSYLFQMKPDGSQLLDADVDHMNIDDIIYEYPNGGTLISSNYSSEGNKIYKRNGYYYLLHIEFIGSNPGTYIYRSRNIYGTLSDGTPGQPGKPGRYEMRRTDRPASKGGKYEQELPGQGGLVNTPDGRWFYIAQFNRNGSDGRTPCLLPVIWINDWPVIGDKIEEGYGKMAWELKKPVLSMKPLLPQQSDQFNSDKLSAFWQWNHQPRPDKWSLIKRKGYLRLYASPTANGKDDFFMASNTLSQRHMRSDSTIVRVKIDLSDMAIGQKAGLVHFNGGKDYAYLGVVFNKSGKRVIYSVNGKIEEGPKLSAGQSSFYICSKSGFNDRQFYSYSVDGKTFKPFGEVYDLKPANFRGDMVGIFTYNNEEGGFIDVDWFKYEVDNK